MDQTYLTIAQAFPRIDQGAATFGFFSFCPCLEPIVHFFLYFSGLQLLSLPSVC